MAEDTSPREEQQFQSSDLSSGLLNTPSFSSIPFEKNNDISLGPDTDRSFSGSDVIAFISPKAIGRDNFIPIKNLATISYSIHRDKVPVRALGVSQAKGYTLGTRTIAGSIVMINFDRAALSELLVGKDIYGDNIQVSLYDEIPPFDLTLMFTNEGADKMWKGNDFSSSTKIYSVLEIRNLRLIDEGMVTGTEESFLETTFQYVAEDIKYLQPIKMPSSNNAPMELL